MDSEVRVPATLPVVTEMGRHESGRAWLARLPALIGALRREWRLRLGSPFHGGSCSWVAPVRRLDHGGEPAVLKVTWPHPEATGEAEALRLWDGHGAVRVYAHDAERYALLVERCEPGADLNAGLEPGGPADERLAHGAEVLRRLWSAPVPAASGLDSLAEVAAGWADLAEERAARHWPPGTDPGLFALGTELLRELPRSASRAVVLHGDLNPGNVLSARRVPWLAIDAKPMTGDPAYDPWPLVEQVDDPFRHADPAALLAHRTALVAGLLAEDVQRVRAWAVARRVEYVLWSVSLDGDLSDVPELMAGTRTLARLAGL